MKIRRLFTVEGRSPYDGIAFRSATSEIRNPDGSVVFSQSDIEVPQEWSQVACDVLAQKIFPQGGRAHGAEAAAGRRRAGIFVAPCGRQRQDPRRELRQGGVRPPVRHLGLLGLEGRLFRRRSRRARVSRTSSPTCWRRRRRRRTRRNGFNTGLHWAYGIDGPSQGHYYVDYKTGRLTKSASSYEHPQPHACFIQSVADDLVNDGGIMDLWTREARLFKYGSGTGTNFSSLRGGERAAVGRRQVVGPDEFPEDRRPRRGRDQVGRHHAARRQDGDRRRRPSRHRGLHRLEGGRGAEGRGDGSPAPSWRRNTSRP